MPLGSARLHSLTQDFPWYHFRFYGGFFHAREVDPSSSGACPASRQPIILVDFLCCCCLVWLLSSQIAHSPSDSEKQEQICILGALAQDVALQPLPEVMFPRRFLPGICPTVSHSGIPELTFLQWESLGWRPTWVGMALQQPVPRAGHSEPQTMLSHGGQASVAAFPLGCPVPFHPPGFPARL